MQRNDIKKETVIDHWYVWYCKNAARRQHKSDKKLAVKKLRTIKKKECKEEE